MSFPTVVDAAWLASELGAADLVVGDVRGPNAHMRGHIPGSRPLVLGSPPPGADQASVQELAKEVALRHPTAVAVAVPAVSVCCWVWL